MLRHETSGPQGCTYVSEEGDEAIWQSRSDRDRPASLLSRCYESHRKPGSPGNREVGKQPSGKLSSAISKARTRHAQISTNANSAEIRLGPFVRPQPLQPSEKHRAQNQVQRSPTRRSGRVAWTSRCLGHAREIGCWRLVRVRLTAPSQGWSSGATTQDDLATVTDRMTLI